MKRRPASVADAKLSIDAQNWNTSPSFPFYFSFFPGKIQPPPAVFLQFFSDSNFGAPTPLRQLFNVKVERVHM